MNKTLVVLAGGFGTRLQSVLNGLPKPLADINGEPFLKYQFENWIKNGINDFVLSLHYRSELIIDFLEKNNNSLLKNCNIRYVIENKPLGTGGAIANLITLLQISDPFLVTNADTWIDCGFDELVKREGCEIGLIKVENASRYGTVKLDMQGNIIKFEEKVESLNGGIINIGLYRLEKSVFSKVKKSQFSLEMELFPLLIKEKILKGSILKTKFIDIGIPADYIEFCKWQK